MNELEQALQKLSGVKNISGGWQAHCPCHDDKHQSLSVAEKEGRLMLYCHAGCNFTDIVKALDLRSNGKNDTSIITNTYDYTNQEGKLLYQVVRYYPKSFKQRRPDGVGGWIWNLQGITSTLYKLPEVLTAIKEGEQVIVVEGEKDVETLMSHNAVATTISGGVSTKWPPELIPLFELAHVVIIPDSDAAGKKYAHYIASILDGWCSSLKVVELPLGRDVSEYLQTQTYDNLKNLVLNTGEYVVRGSVTREEFDSWKGVNRYLWGKLHSVNGGKKAQKQLKAIEV